MNQELEQERRFPAPHWLLLPGHPSLWGPSHLSSWPLRPSPLSQKLRQDTWNPGVSLLKGPPGTTGRLRVREGKCPVSHTAGQQYGRPDPEAQPVLIATLKSLHSRVARAHKWGSPQRPLHTQSSPFPGPVGLFSSLQASLTQHPAKGVSTPHPTLCPASPRSPGLDPQGPDSWGQSPPGQPVSLEA